MDNKATPKKLKVNVKGVDCIGADIMTGKQDFELVCV